jgi:phage gp36-like protein
MAYSTITDIQDQLSEAELIGLTDDAGAGAIDADVVGRAIADADEEIDGYIGNRAKVPLSPVPGIVRKMSVDIAVYNLYARRHDTIPDIRGKRYENALKFLVQVAAGKITLGAADPEGNPPSSSGIAAKTFDQVMTSSKLSNF